MNTEVVNLNSIKLKKKRNAAYEYFDQIAGEEERFITKKRFLPAVPFVGVISDVVEEYELIIKEHFAGILNEERKAMEI